jgi:hypothetical protein
MTTGRVWWKIPKNSGNGQHQIVVAIVTIKARLTQATAPSPWHRPM